MRFCPFPDCGAQIPDALFACRPHWFSLRHQQRLVIQAAYDDYPDRIGVERLREIQQGVMDEVLSTEKT